MHIIPIKISVVTPGVPVTFASVIAAMNLPAERVPLNKINAIKLYPQLGNTGNSYIGLTATAPCAGGVAMNKTTGVNVIKQLFPAAASGHQDAFELFDFEGGNSLLISDYAMDADTAAQGVIGHLVAF